MSRETSYDHQCSVCDSPALGINFGVMTCAPCKAFFRRNARRKELMQIPCRHRTFSSVINHNVYIRERAARYLQIRRCSSCRLRRCFEVGMKEELVRTDAENQQHRKLVEINRKRREELKEQLLEMKRLSMPQKLWNESQLSNDIDWQHLSNITYAYEDRCVKQFVEKRSTIIFTEDYNSSSTTNRSLQIKPTEITGTIIVCSLSFFQSLPLFHTLSHSTRNYLIRTNVRPLLFPNIHELIDNSYSEPWQTESYVATWKKMCGPEIYPDFCYVEHLMRKHIINDPIVIRLWMVILFFSTPLQYHNDSQSTTPLFEKKSAITDAQNAYTTLFWKYLLHRHQENEAVRIFTDLIRVYLKMQQVGSEIYLNLRSKQDLLSTHETLNRLVTVETDEFQETTDFLLK